MLPFPVECHALLRPPEITERNERNEISCIQDFQQNLLGENKCQVSVEHDVRDPTGLELKRERSGDW